MSFIWADLLWLLLVVPVLVAAYVWMQRRRKKYALRYASLSLVKQAMGRGPGWRRHVPPVLFLVGLAIMLLALARPTATLRLPSRQGTIILTLDVSRSMQAEDVTPNRLEAAKAAALTLVKDQPKNVRIGVVAFSDGAVIVQAPTSDKQAVTAAITQLEPQRGTAIGSGILMSLNALFGGTVAQPTVRSGGRLQGPPPTPTAVPVPAGSDTSAVIVLLTDGQSTVGPPPLDVVDQASNRGVRVYTVGLGSKDGTVLRFGGRAARVMLDEETLKRIAQATGGQYFNATNEADLRNIYSDLSTRLVFKTERTEITAAFTGAAAVVMLVGGVLSLLWFSRMP